MKRHPIKNTIQNRSGIALIMVLWVVAILSVVVLEFCFGMRTEINITHHYKEELQLQAMADGGIERAIAELVCKNDPGVQQIRKLRKDEAIPADQKEWITDGRSYPLSFDQGVCEIRVTSELGKININQVSEMLLRKMMTNMGLKAEARDTITDSILDWIDADDLHRVNGAENDYYQSLKEPYNCKNAKLDSIEELLLVRGVTPDIYNGRKTVNTINKVNKGEEDPDSNPVALKDIFSVYSTGEQIDVNSASLAVLRAVLGVPTEISQRMIKAREEKGFENQQDLLTRVPEASSFITKISGNIIYQSTLPFYTIESRAKSKEGKSFRGVKALIKIDGAEKKGYKIIQWVDTLPLTQ
jgi:general secretion pathway protein K